MSTVTATKTKTYDLAYIAIFAVLIAICSWISIPMTVPFTLQTFGVFMAVGVLGGKRGSLAVLVYILLGAIGVPVFAGFSGGLGILLNNTGGYIIGFLFSALVMWAMESLWGKKPVIQILSMVVGLIVCYAMGTIWFMVVYTRTSGAVGLGTVLGWCVIPFIIPDLVKIALAFVLSRRVRKLVPMQKKERQTYPIRPHHGMCLAFFIGNGYSTGFTAHMQEMLELFTKGADVCLTVKTDEICSACPNNSQGICEAAEKVKRYDNAVLAECGLKEGQKLAFPEFTEAVQKKIIETGKRTKICGDCQWNRICQEQPSRWSK